MTAGKPDWQSVASREALEHAVDMLHHSIQKRLRLNLGTPFSTHTSEKLFLFQNAFSLQVHSI